MQFKFCGGVRALSCPSIFKWNSLAIMEAVTGGDAVFFRISSTFKIVGCDVDVMGCM